MGTAFVRRLTCLASRWAPCAHTWAGVWNDSATSWRSPMASRLDELIREHAERLDELAGPIDLSDVISARRNDSASVTLIDTEPAATQVEGSHRWPIIAVAAAVTAIVVGGLMVATRTDDPTGEVPADQPATTAPSSVAQVTEESLQLSDRRVREAAALRIGFVGLP